MDIEKIRKEKVLLESKIKTLLDEFTVNTQTSVREINLRHVYNNSGMERITETYVWTRVEV